MPVFLDAGCPLRDYPGASARPRRSVIAKPKIRWNVSPRQAIVLQKRWAKRVILVDRIGRLETVAGADIAFDPSTHAAFAGVVLYRFPELFEIERVSVQGALRFPYIPGLLSFRESPLLLAAFARLKTAPDLILIDGHGLAHPRRFGIACHIGVLLDKPVIGCAKSLLVGEHRALSNKAGAAVPLTFRGETVGMVLRSREGVKPIYVTQGHRVSLPTTLKLAKQCLDGLRIPKPTREADHYVGALRIAYQQSQAAQ